MSSLWDKRIRQRLIITLLEIIVDIEILLGLPATAVNRIQRVNRKAGFYLASRARPGREQPNEQKDSWKAHHRCERQSETSKDLKKGAMGESYVLPTLVLGFVP